MEQFTCSLLFLYASGAGPELKEMTHVLPSQALPYVCLLIAMLFFIYAIIGMQVGTDSSASSPLARPCAQHHAAQQPTRVPRGVPGVGELIWEPQSLWHCWDPSCPPHLYPWGCGGSAGHPVQQLLPNHHPFIPQALCF